MLILLDLANWSKNKGYIIALNFLRYYFTDIIGFAGGSRFFKEIFFTS